ncbi:hypothetical protein [Planctomyces sp. SH-PL14]|uniref:hypothetical protein n=1 Tax=Planctomyces sp. SH-PL14 TaxID=1632864 RepID=UPI0009463531|nr:hypothetical protein [Planctomyces sp. SH-PL14]
MPLAGRLGSFVSGGLDWFEGSFSVSFDPITRSRLIRELDAIKARCQETSIPDECVRLLGRVDVRVHRLGINRGGERGTHYAYQISYAGITIGLGDWNAEERQADNLFVRMTGETCLLKGACLVEAGHFITRFKAVHPQTELVVAGELVFGKIDGELIPVDRSLISPIRVFKQGFGCFVSGFKQMGVPITRRAELVRHVVKAVDGVMDSSEKWADFFDEYRLLLEECST